MKTLKFHNLISKQAKREIYIPHSNENENNEMKLLPFFQPSQFRFTLLLLFSG